MILYNITISTDLQAIFVHIKGLEPAIIHVKDNSSWCFLANFLKKIEKIKYPEFNNELQNIVSLSVYKDSLKIYCKENLEDNTLYHLFVSEWSDFTEGKGNVEEDDGYQPTFKCNDYIF